MARVNSNKHTIEGLYNWANNPIELLELLQQGKHIICLVDYMDEAKDIAVARKCAYGEFDLSVRGISYIYTLSADEFLAACKHKHVLFLRPSNDG